MGEIVTGDYRGSAPSDSLLFGLALLQACFEVFVPCNAIGECNIKITTDMKRVIRCKFS